MTMRTALTLPGTRWRLATPAAACAVVAVATCVSLPARQPPGWHADENIAVPMRDGVVLRADVFRPSGDGRRPTLVYRTPYDKTGSARDSIVAAAVRRGYAVVLQDVRGRYASAGEFQAYHQEGKDGFDTIEWAAAQPWSNGRVGTFGLSYPGAVQWLAALESPPHLGAMAPAMTFASPSHFWYTGGVWDSSWLLWTWLNMAPDLRRRAGVEGARSDEAARATWRTEGRAALLSRPLSALPAFKGLAPWYYEWMRHPPYDPWWEWAEITGKYGRVSAAVLNLSGWHDEMYGPVGAATNFAGLVAARGGQARSARTQVVLGPWTHGTDLATTRVGAREMGPAAALDYDTLVLDWMDRWLRGVDNGVDRRPPVRAYVMGANAWRSGDVWPPPAEPRTLYLAGTARASSTPGTLTWTPPSVTTTAQFVSDAAHPVRDPHDGEFGALDFRALSRDPGVVTYDSAPLADDLEVLGPIAAAMFVSVDAPDTDLWVKILDVHPDGTAYNVMSAGLDVVRASYRNRRPERELLQPGTAYRLDFSTLMTGNRFLKGHRIRVALMASFAPNMSWNLHTGALEFDSAATAVARIIVHSSAAYPSRLVLPVRSR
jgi:putative CocE/NonD family hydrolase